MAVEEITHVRYRAACELCERTSMAAGKPWIAETVAEVEGFKKIAGVQLCPGCYTMWKSKQRQQKKSAR